MTLSYKVFFLLLFITFIQCKENQPIEKSEEKTMVEKQNTESKKIAEKKRVKNQAEEKPKVAKKKTNKATPKNKPKTKPKQVQEVKKTVKKPIKKVKKVVPKKSKGEVAFFKTTHNYGRIEMGEKVEHVFKFVNKGEEPVSIENVDVSCGCTTPVFPFVPIKPGKIGSVKVLFDSENRLGPQESTITVFTDGKTPEIELIMKGEIITEIAQPFDSLKQKK